MIKRVLKIALVITIVLSVGTVFASSSSKIKMIDARNIEIPVSGNRLICVDGVKVFQTIIYVDGKGVAVSNTQLFIEKDGKSVPSYCKM